MLGNNVGLIRNKNLVIIIIVTLGFIWGNSALPADVSSVISGNLMRFICSLNGNGDETVSDGYLRKFAHAFEYACLGTEIFLLIRFNIKKYVSSAVLFGLSVAVIDETIQLFSEGRGSQIKDIWIDMLGFFIGTFITLTFLRNVKNNKDEKLFDTALSKKGDDKIEE